MSIPPSFHHDQNLLSPSSRSPSTNQPSTSHSQSMPKLDTYVPPPSAFYPSFLGESELGYPRAPYTNNSNQSLHQAVNQSFNPYGGLETLASGQDVYRSIAVEAFGESLEQLSLQQDHELTNRSIKACFSDFEFPSLSRNELSLDPKHDLNPKHDAYQSNNAFEQVQEEDMCTPSAEPSTPPGGYLDPNCHFFINTPPVEALNQMHDLLKQKNVDVEVWWPCFKLKCHAYRDCSSVEFYVRVFQTTEEQRAEHGRLYAVEFQRRFGDGMAFHQIYNDFKQSYISSSPSNSPSNTTNSLACPSLDLPDMQCCKVQQESVLRSLMSMCDSDCVDVKAQAIMALAEMTCTANCELKTAMFSLGVVQVFIRGLCCKYTDVHRCAVTGLANMISCRRNYQLCDGILSDAEALDSMSELIRTGCPQVVRECARSFAFLVDTMPDKVRNEPCVKSCVQALLSSEDSQAREMAQHVQTTLSAL